MVSLDDELLQGGVLISEWCSFLVKQADVAFAGGAHLAALLTAVAGIETYLRSEYSTGRKERLVELIDNSHIDGNLKAELHTLRKYRNKWVHVDDPWDDQGLLELPERTEDQLEQMGIMAVRSLRKTIYENPWI